MPSLFDFIKRMAKGEPVFQPEDTSFKADEQSDAAETSSRAKTVPEAIIVREDCRIDGKRMTCDADIQNSSRQSIFLDEVTIFNVKTELQRQLGPGERREFRIYDGSAVTSNFTDYCYVLYRDESGDYFRSNHDVDGETLPDGTQLVKRIRFMPPVKDV